MARLSSPGWLVTYRDTCPAPGIEPGHGTHPSTNRARRSLTSLIVCNKGITQFYLPPTHTSLYERFRDKGLKRYIYSSVYFYFFTFVTIHCLCHHHLVPINGRWWSVVDKTSEACWIRLVCYHHTLCMPACVHVWAISAIMRTMENKRYMWDFVHLFVFLSAQARPADSDGRERCKATSTERVRKYVHFVIFYFALYEIYAQIIKLHIAQSFVSSSSSSSSSSSQVFLEWPKQQRHHEDHYSQSKYSRIKECSSVVTAAE